MKAIKSICFILLALPFVINAQEEEPDNRPVSSPWESSILIDNQTIIGPVQRQLDFTIHHRFSTFEEGISNIYGIYGASNIRLGLDYGISDKLMVGIGTEKDAKQQDLQWKYSILQQTRSGSMPVGLSYFGNAVLDLRDSSFFGVGEMKFSHRLSYFHQLIISRKFGKRISVQVAPCFIYYNAVMPDVNNMHFGVSVGGRYRVTSGTSIIAEYDQLLTKNDAEDIKPNIAFGVEFGTPTHSFRLFCASYREITYQRNFVYNTNDFFDGGAMIGFNITVRFSI
ncbi:DUF5777 family beta-barrel protein [Bacteroidota bacterium]